MDNRLRRPALKVCAQPRGQAMDGVPPPTTCPPACTQTRAFVHIPTGFDSNKFRFSFQGQKDKTKLSAFGVFFGAVNRQRIKRRARKKILYKSTQTGGGLGHQL